MFKERYKLILVAGARPNFMKIAPLMRALEGHPAINAVIAHTGQHYDERMSELFFKELEIPKPEINLGVGSASHAVQTARIMERFEGVCLDRRPDMVMVVGDVNSTAACTLVASKLNIETAHYEAGRQELRQIDAGGDKPRRYGCGVRLLLHHQRGRKRESSSVRESLRNGSFSWET